MEQPLVLDLSGKPFFPSAGIILIEQMGYNSQFLPLFFWILAMLSEPCIGVDAVAAGSRVACCADGSRVVGATSGPTAGNKKWSYPN